MLKTKHPIQKRKPQWNEGNLVQEYVCKVAIQLKINKVAPNGQLECLTHQNVNPYNLLSRWTYNPMVYKQEADKLV